MNIIQYFGLLDLAIILSAVMLMIAAWQQN